MKALPSGNQAVEHVVELQQSSDIQAPYVPVQASEVPEVFFLLLLLTLLLLALHHAPTNVAAASSACCHGFISCKTISLILVRLQNPKP